MKIAAFLKVAFVSFAFVLTATGQTASPPSQTRQAVAPPAPSTKLEGFRPAAGTVVTFGYENLGALGGIHVDARELRDSKGASVRGLLVEVTQGEYRDESAFVDEDEIPELLKGFDALLQVTSNPTEFSNFEVRYSTKGDLRLTAFNDSSGKILYAVQAGRISKAESLGLSSEQMQQLRGMFLAAQQKLAGLKKA